MQVDGVILEFSTVVGTEDGAQVVTRGRPTEGGTGFRALRSRRRRWFHGAVSDRGFGTEPAADSFAAKVAGISSANVPARLVKLKLEQYLR